MCTGLELAALGVAGLGSAVSAAGAARQMREQQANAVRAAQARNDQLKNTQLKNEKIADEAREGFDKRLKDSTSQQMDADQASAGQERTADLVAAAEAPVATTAGASLAGSTPAVVQSEAARRLGEALDFSRNRSKALGKLGSYGDMWANRGFEDADLARNLGVLSNFQEGNLSGLGVRQDVAENASQKPLSMTGGLMQGIGGFMGSFAGAGLPGITSVPGLAGLGKAGISSATKTAVKANPYGGLF